MPKAPPHSQPLDLFGAKGQHGTDLHGAACRKPTGKDCHRNEHCASPCHDSGILSKWDRQYPATFFVSFVPTLTNVICLEKATHGNVLCKQKLKRLFGFGERRQV